jgi:hypothetical protein
MENSELVFKILSSVPARVMATGTWEDVARSVKEAIDYHLAEIGMPHGSATARGIRTASTNIAKTAWLEIKGIK